MYLWANLLRCLEWRLVGMSRIPRLSLARAVSHQRNCPLSPLQRQAQSGYIRALWFNS
jgi:hypothetical protein